MADLDVVERVATLLAVAVFHPRVRDPKWRPTYRASITGWRAVHLMQLLRPLMGRRRQGQIDMALAASGTLRRRLGDREHRDVARRFRAGERAVTLAQEYGLTREYVYRIVKKVT